MMMAMTVIIIIIVNQSAAIIIGVTIQQFGITIVVHKWCKPFTIFSLPELMIVVHADHDYFYNSSGYPPTIYLPTAAN